MYITGCRMKGNKYVKEQYSIINEARNDMSDDERKERVKCLAITSETGRSSTTERVTLALQINNK